MTALFMDSFDHYGSGNAGFTTLENPAFNNAQSAGWSFTTNSTYQLELAAPPWGAARTGPYALRRLTTPLDPTCLATRALPATATRIFVSFAVGFDTLPLATARFFRVRTAAAGNLYSLRCLPSGALAVYNDSTGVAIATTAGPVITAATWFFLEMDINTAGNWTLRVNDALGTDTPVLTAALAGGTMGLIVFFDEDAGTEISIDDVFVRDALGTVNNGWLGDRRIATMFPSDDTDDDGWTPHFYKQISDGHARLAYIQTGLSAIQQSTAAIKTSQATALNIGNQAFTLESFIRLDRLPLTTEYYTIFNKWNEGNATGRSYQLRYTGPTDGSVLEFRTSTDGTSGTVVSKIRYPWNPERGRWYHVALCRVAGELLLFVDGVQLGLPIADADTYFAATNAAMSIGTQLNSTTTTGAGVAGSTFIGRLDETRFTNGVGRYTSSFTPPTTKFPRGVTDPDWASVVLLMGYDQGVADESSFARTMVISNGATNIIATDGDPPGAWTTVGKAVPDDNTFIRASLTNASNILTMTTNPTAATTVTVGTEDGIAPAVYTFVAVLANPYDVLIGANAEATLTNLIAAINAGPGEGTVYGTGTLSNADVLASDLPTGQIMVTALIAGTIGNSIASTSTSTGSWDSATLTGGQDIPGRSSFKLERPPTNTTIISAVQLTTRASKTDSGVGSMQASLIGPLGGIEDGPVHSLSVNGATYNDIIEVDPDTSGPISPTTLINGRVSVNRTL